MDTDVRTGDAAPQPWQRLRELAAAGDGAGAQALLTALEPTETVRALFRLSAEEQGDLVELLSPGHAAELLEDLPDAHAAGLIERMDAEQAADIVEELASDHGADLLGALDAEDAQAILDEMAPVSAEQVRDLIGYPSDVAGGLMTTEHFAYPERARIRDVLGSLKQRREEFGQLPQRIVLVDAERRPTGAIEIADIIGAAPEMSLTNFKQSVVPVPADASLDALEDYFDRYETLGAPIVDADGRLVGRLRRRALLDALAEKAQTDRFKAQGIVGGDELRSMPVLARSKRRLSWLSINILLNILAASVIAVFQDTVSAVIALAVFLPIVSDMSGCSGNQAVAVSMRELTLGIIRPSDVLRVWWQEVSVGLLNGLALGLLISLVAFLWQGNPLLGAVIGIALGLNTIIAVSIGGTVPLVLKRWRADPAVASGPILTTVTDMCGFFLVLGLATLALPWLV